jgi:hypothetical protein
MSNRFTNLLRSTAKDLSSKSSESSEWYKDTVQNMGKRDPNKIFEKASSPQIGSLMLFLYDPKYKNTLPFYDAHPLVFPVEMYNDGFLGINLHYLPPVARVNIMKGLVGINDNDKYIKNKKLFLSYSLLRLYSRQLIGVENCIKRYLYNHVRSSFYLVDPQDWEKAALLPLQRWNINPNRRYAGSPPY